MKIKYFCKSTMSHEYFMQRCLQLAEFGRGMVAPNPMVGCVIVHNGLIIGEGYHHKYGEAHAEVNAINSVSDKTLLPSSTVYVSLEPCAHTGKTPPCAHLLIAHKIKKVVIGSTDTNKAAGGGIQLLKAAGIEVEVGILEETCRELNIRFFTFYEKQRPYIILKWAETKDGFIAGAQKQISGTLAQTLLHQWRTEESAFMVGTKTLLEDDPRLNVRLWKGRNPIRIAIDNELRSEEVHKINPLHFYDGSQTTIILNGLKDEQTNNVEYLKIDDTSPMTICKALHQKNIQSVVIEGGKLLLQSFINSNLFDEIRVFKSKELIFGNGLRSPEFTAKENSVLDLETDNLTIFENV